MRGSTPSETAMPAVEACAAMLLALAATQDTAPAFDAPPAPELLMYLAEFDADPVAVDEAMARDDAPSDAPASPLARNEAKKSDDDAPR